MSDRDIAIPLVAAARVFRLHGELDAAELQLNAAAKAFRDAGLPNTSRAYRHESRNLFYSRYVDNARAELKQALLLKTGLGWMATLPHEDSDPTLIHDVNTEQMNDYVNDVEIPSGLLTYDKE